MAKNFKIDASGKSLGRLAVEIASVLRGKNEVDFDPSKDSGNSVVVDNFSKVKITGKKLKQKKYYSHSGYLGSLREKGMGELLRENPQEVLKKTVWGMLPNNKLRRKIIKRLKINASSKN